MKQYIPYSILSNLLNKNLETYLHLFLHSAGNNVPAVLERDSVDSRQLHQPLESNAGTPTRLLRNPNVGRCFEADSAAAHSVSLPLGSHSGRDLEEHVQKQG